MKEITYNDKVGFIPEIKGWFSMQKSFNIVYHY
jgi:hypothetical protein